LPHLLAIDFIAPLDVILFPVAFAIFYFIIRARANRQKEERLKRLYFRAFYFKVICVIAFTLITQFYFKGGDTTLYYSAAKDLKAAIDDNQDNISLIINTSKLTIDHPLTPYFYYDNNEYDITYNYMISASNFFPGKIALVPFILFRGSYLCINLFFGFFALGGAIRLFKVFYHFYPSRWREIAAACLFLPGVAFWSASLLKDPITFGCIGYILFALKQIVFQKEKIGASALMMFIAGYLLFIIKIYILLVLVLSLTVWFFAEFNKTIKEKVLRYIFTIMTFAGSAVIGFFLLNYLTSFEAAQEYKLDTLLDSAETQRNGYEAINRNLQGDSHFKINASNPVTLFFGSIVATFFRPFLWEVNTPIALLSAFESAIFLFLTLFIMFKRGIINFFSVSFSDGRILMCFVFAIVFAFAIGSSTANFGALSRYKIPCMPFYMLFLILLYDKQGLPYPKWFKKVINFAIPPKSIA
jgi:heme/copper-type cytochrome/quinol oxidase subunit 2